MRAACNFQFVQKILLAGKNFVFPQDILIVGIERGAFTGLEELTELVIPEGVVVIKNAFNHCDNLKTVVIPRSVKELSQDAFSYNKGLTILYKGSEEEWSQIVLKQYAIRGVSRVIYDYSEN